jgi:hypothetical protein
MQLLVILAVAYYFFILGIDLREEYRVRRYFKKR